MRGAWEEMPATIAAVADWLRSSDQPEDSVLSQFGMSTHLGHGLGVESAVHGWQSGPGGELGTTESAFFRVSVGRDDDGTEPEPFTAEEMDEVRALFTENGIEVVDHWHGAGMEGGSFGLRVPGGVSPSLAATHQRYRDHCPKHGSVFCGERATWGMKDDEREAALADPDSEANCTWWSRGRALAVPPAWIIVEREPTSSSTPEKSDDDRSLEAVKRALEKLAPLVAQLGVHPATMTAGHKGRIVEEDDGLRFQGGDGHGVQFPAETAMELVRLALIGWEVEG